MLYVNNDIVKVEFNLKQSKDFYFVVDDELLVAKVVEGGDEFLYHLEKAEINENIPIFKRLKNWLNL